MIFALILYFAIGFVLATLFAMIEANVIAQNPKLDFGLAPRIFSYLKMVLDWPVFVIEIIFYKSFFGKIPYADAEIKIKNGKDKL